MLSGWSNTRAKIRFKNCENYSRSTLGVAQYLRNYWHRRSDVGCYILLRAPAQQRGTQASVHIFTVIFSAIKQNRVARNRAGRESTVLIIRRATTVGYLLMMFFWIKGPCRLVGRNRRFGRACCLHRQGWSDYRGLKGTIYVGWQRGQPGGVRHSAGPMCRTEIGVRGGEGRTDRQTDR
jgi:hypothetical protein